MKDTFEHNVQKPENDKTQFRWIIFVSIEPLDIMSQKLRTAEESYVDGLCVNGTFGHNVQKLRMAEASHVADLCINGTFGHNVQKLRIAEVSYVADLYIKDASRQIVAEVDISRKEG